MLGVRLGQSQHRCKCVADHPTEIQAARLNSLYFIKHHNTGSNRVEVHRVSPTTNYGLCDVHAVTPIYPADSANGLWQVENDNVYFIKTRNAESNTIEVHSLSNSSGYSRFNIQSPSGFNIADHGTGTWTIDKGDLYFIKTQNTGSGFVEVHRADHRRNFAVELHAVTPFQLSDEANGYFTVRGGDLYFIKTRNVPKVEVYCAAGGQRFQSLSYLHVTCFCGSINPHTLPIDDDRNGVWDIGTNGDLYLISKGNPESGRIEVHIAKASSGYQEVLHFASEFLASDGPNGSWCV